MSTEPKGSLKKRILKAGGWNVLQIVIGNAMRLGSNLVMTRLLVPEAFGLMAFIMTIVVAFTLLSDIGIQRSVVRDPEGDTAHYLRAAWVVQIYRAAAISGGVLLIAILTPFLAASFAPPNTVYADPLLPFLLAGISLVPFLDGLKSTNCYLAERLFHNGRIASVELVSQLAGIILQIAIAWVWPTVWALVIGTIFNQALRSILSHFLFSGPRMNWEPDREIAAQIWSFGKFIMGSSGLTFAAQNADKFILASLLGSASFGLYAIAQIWIGAVRTLLMKLTNQVGFAALGEVIRTRPAEAPALFRRFQRAMDLLYLGAFLICALFGRPFIGLLYTAEYQAAGHYLTLLSLSLLAIRFDPMNMFLLNHGNSRAMMVISGIRALSVVVFLPLSYSLVGFEGALLAVALTPLSSAPYTTWLIRPLLGQAYAARQVVWILAIICAAAAAYLTY